MDKNNLIEFMYQTVQKNGIPAGELLEDFTRLYFKRDKTAYVAYWIIYKDSTALVKSLNLEAKDIQAIYKIVFQDSYTISKIEYKELNADAFASWMFATAQIYITKHFFDVFIDAKTVADIVQADKEYSFFWMLRESGTWIVNSVEEVEERKKIIAQKAIYYITYKNNLFTILRYE